MADSTEKIGSRNLSFRAVRGIPWRHVGVVPQKLRDRNAPLRLSRRDTLPQHPRRVRIFKAIYCVAKADVVFPLEIWKLIVIVARAGAVGKNFIEIRVGVVMKNSVTKRWIAVAGSA